MHFLILLTEITECIKFKIKDERVQGINYSTFGSKFSSEFCYSMSVHTHAKCAGSVMYSAQVFFVHASVTLEVCSCMCDSNRTVVFKLYFAELQSLGQIIRYFIKMSFFIYNFLCILTGRLVK